MAIPNYLEGLFSPDQIGNIRSQAISQGLLGLGQGLVAAGAPTTSPAMNLSGISTGLSAFGQGYKGAFDTALSDMLKATQIQQTLRKQKEEEQVKNIIGSAAVPQYKTIPAVVPQGQTAIDEMGVTTLGTIPERQELTGYTYDVQKAAPMLAALGRFDLIKQMEDASALLGGSTMKPADVAGQVKEAVQVLGITDEKGRLKTPDKFTQEDRIRVQNYITASDEAKAPKINKADPTAVLVAQQGNVKEFNAQVKDFNEVSRRYNAMVGAWRDKANPATDSALIYGLAKIYDPAGAVQQGDIATIKGKPSIPQSLVSLAERVSRGGELTPKQRDDVMSTAYTLVNSYSRQVQPQVDTYKSFSKQFGGDPNQIRNPFENLQKPEYIMVTVAGKQVKAELSPKDNEYYYKSGDKYYKVTY